MESYPKPSNSLLTCEEKRFLDHAPDKAVVKLLALPESNSIKLTHIPDDASGVYCYVFEGERAQAVRDYFRMQIEFGLRDI
jgi:hypothetical protein